MHDNSIEAYNSIVADLGKKQKKVLDVVVKATKITRQGIAQWLGWEINQVTGRVTELKAQGLIKEEGKVMVGGRNRSILVPVQKDDYTGEEG